MLNRRGFLKRLGAAVAGYALAGRLAGIVPKPPVLEEPEDAPTEYACRIDVLYGFKVLRPEFAVRMVVAE